jgi:hypothetical protein
LIPWIGWAAVPAPANAQSEIDCEPPQGIIRTMGLSITDVRLDYIGDYLVIRSRTGGGDSLSMGGFDPLTPYAELGRFEFDDGVLCTRDFVKKGFDLIGTDEAEVILGTNALDRIHGKRGNDTLQGRDGDDVYIYELGDGVDCIADSSGRITIAFGPGIEPEAVAVALDGGRRSRALHVRVIAPNDDASAQGMNILLGRDSDPPETFEFSNGASHALADLKRMTARDRRRAGREHVCHFDLQEAAQAGLIDKREHGSVLPPIPRPTGPIRIPQRDLRSPQVVDSAGNLYE